DIRAVESAGAYSVVIEGVPIDVGTQLSRAVNIPTIGIGAGPGCDGQVLVSYDMLGLVKDFKPRFVKRFGELGQAVVDATRQYVEAVQSGAFPDSEHSFAPRRTTPKSVEDTGAGALTVTSPVYGPAEDE